MTLTKGKKWKKKKKKSEGTRNRGGGVLGKKEESVDSPSSRVGIPLRPTPPRNLTLGKERRGKKERGKKIPRVVTNEEILTLTTTGEGEAKGACWMVTGHSLAIEGVPGCEKERPRWQMQ